MRCLQLCPYFNFVSGPEELARTRRIFADCLAAAAALDCQRLRVFTGPPWGAGVVGAKDATPGPVAGRHRRPARVLHGRGRAGDRVMSGMP